MIAPETKERSMTDIPSDETPESDSEEQTTRRWRWHSPGPSEEDKIVPRPRNERAPISDLLGKWGGDIDDGFDDWLAEERRGTRRRWTQ
jgi:hypothetical protein